MAIYHLKVSTISRASGRSATAAAAYRAGALIVDARTGGRFDYRRRRGVADGGLVGWTGERDALWNLAEMSEKRRDARVAREIVAALPHELSPAGRRRAVVAFASELRRRHGVAAQWDIHDPDRGGDERNWHAHFLLTVRRVDDAGRFGEKCRELDDPSRSGAEINQWREAWETILNAELARDGAAARVDRRSLVDRGEERAPLEHLGPSASRMERRARGSSARGRRNQARRREAAETAAVGTDLARVEREIARHDPADARRRDADDVRMLVETAPRRHRPTDDRQPPPWVRFGLRRDTWLALSREDRRLFYAFDRTRRARAAAALRRRHGPSALHRLQRLIGRAPGGGWHTIYDLWRATRRGVSAHVRSLMSDEPERAPGHER